MNCMPSHRLYSNDARGVLISRDPLSGMQADPADPLVLLLVLLSSGVLLHQGKYYLALWQLDDSSFVYRHWKHGRYGVWE